MYPASTVKCELMLETMLKKQHTVLNLQVTAFSHVL
jgi:hypothetical protein